MLTPAFSSVACPEWTLQTIAANAVEFGFPAVELRTFGDGSRQFAGDPALSSHEKTLITFRDAGVSVCSIATGNAFHHAVDPPVLGHAICDTELHVRAAKRAIDLAAAIECPLVRVFGFMLSGAGGRKASVHRIAERLIKVVDHADRTGVRIVLENGGDFSTSAEVMEILDKVTSPLLGACYNSAVGFIAGERPADAVTVLGNRLLAVKIKDIRAGLPVALGSGDVDNAGLVSACMTTGLKIPMIYEWDKAWIPALASAETVLPGAARTLFAMLSNTPPAPDPSGRAPARRALHA